MVLQTTINGTKKWKLDALCLYSNINKYMHVLHILICNYIYEHAVPLQEASSLGSLHFYKV